jgi:hypothetical protein
MTDRIVALILDEGKWLFAAMLLSGLAVAVLIGRQRKRKIEPVQVVIIQAMNLFYGCLIGIMAFGHLLAITIKLYQGTLPGSLWKLYLIGFVLAVPAWWLVVEVARIASSKERWSGKIVLLNTCLILFLLILGLHNLPLAAPAILSLAYMWHSKGLVGWTIATVALAAILGLFIGSVVFVYSGQTFEQFTGIE